MIAACLVLTGFLLLRPAIGRIPGALMLALWRLYLGRAGLTSVMPLLPAGGQTLHDRREREGGTGRSLDEEFELLEDAVLSREIARIYKDSHPT
jgi:hypothetical protein